MSTSTQAGRDAEDIAAKYLEEKGFKIIERNWKTRWCELDIVAKKCGRFGRNCRVHFVEVKYRRSNEQGRPEEYVDDKKLRQLKLGAEMWAANQRWEGDMQLDVIAVDILGEVTNFPNITG